MPKDAYESIICLDLTLHLDTAQWLLDALDTATAVKPPPRNFYEAIASLRQCLASPPGTQFDSDNLPSSQSLN